MRAVASVAGAVALACMVAACGDAAREGVALSDPGVTAGHRAVGAGPAPPAHVPTTSDRVTDPAATRENAGPGPAVTAGHRAVGAGPAPPAHVPTTSATDPDAAPLVALIPSDDDTITAALRAGLDLAFDESRTAGGPDLALRVATKSAKWGSAVDAAVTDAVETNALAIVAPPERRHAHLLLQLGTKLRLPVISTSAAYGVVAAGSRYVAAVVPARAGVRDEAPVAPDFDTASPAAAAFVASFRRKFDRAPAAWDAVGYDAGRCLVEAARTHGLRRAGLVAALTGGPAVRGAGWSIAFETNGASRRVPAPGK